MMRYVVGWCCKRTKKYIPGTFGGTEEKFTWSAAHETASSLVTSALILPPQLNGVAGASIFGWVLKLGWAGGKSKQEGTALWVRNKIDDDLLAASLRSLS